MISAEARPQGRVARKMQRKASESYNVGNEDDNLSENEMMDKGNAYEEKEKEKQRDLSDSGGSSDEEKPSAYSQAMGNMKMEKKKKKKPAGRSQAHQNRLLLKISGKQRNTLNAITITMLQDITSSIKLLIVNFGLHTQNMY